MCEQKTLLMRDTGRTCLVDFFFFKELVLILVIFCAHGFHLGTSEKATKSVNTETSCAETQLRVCGFIMNIWYFYPIVISSCQGCECSDGLP